MAKEERVKVVRAMDTIARCINDEEVFVPWLSVGVADGDCADDVPDSYILEYYCDSGTFRELLECFMRRMRGALKSGGLYCDGVVTRMEKF